jgi:hypothetical protein
VHDNTTHTSARASVAVSLADRPAPSAGAGAVPAAEPDRPHGPAARPFPRPTHLTSTNGQSGTPRELDHRGFWCSDTPQA